MEKILNEIEAIENLLELGNLETIQEKIIELVSDFIKQIETNKLKDEEIDQISDQFYPLFEYQLKEKKFTPEIEVLLEKCFVLHTFLPQTNLEFTKALVEIKNFS